MRVANIGDRYRKKRANAFRAGHAFELTFAQFADLFETAATSCPVCRRRYGESDAKVSIDRVDSLRGYIVDNVRIICVGCNTFKGHYEGVFDSATAERILTLVRDPTKGARDLSDPFR